MAVPRTLASGVGQVGQTIQEISGALGVELGDIAAKGGKALGIVVLAWLGFRMLRLFTGRFERIVRSGDADQRTEREARAKTLAQLLNSIGGVVISVAAGLMILNLFIEIGPLLAGVGVVGLAISFGAQSLVKDVISGFFLLLENQFAVGDIVEVAGRTGVVERMTMRVVMLRDVEGVLHIIPNGAISSVSNKTRGWARALLDIGVAYGEDVDNVIRVLREVCTDVWSDPDWQPALTEEPVVWGVQALADSAVQIRFVANTQPGRQFEVGRELRRRIKNRFDAEGITIPFPQRMLHFNEGDALVEALAERRSSTTR